MKKINDERLILQNLKNIKVAYIVQTVGIIGILGYDLINHGAETMFKSPVGLVFLISSITSMFLNSKINVDFEKDNKNPKTGLILSILVVIAISVVSGIMISKGDSFDKINGILSGVLIFVCGLIPSFYIYKLRKEKLENLED